MATSQPQPKIIRQEYPNQPILLYDGLAELIYGEKIIQGEAFIKISWYPFPHIIVKFIYSPCEWINNDIKFKTRNAELKLTNVKHQSQVKVYLLN